MTTRRPSDKTLLETLRLVGGLLDTASAGVYEGRFHFPLDGRWSVAISPDSAGRFRVDVCMGAVPRATMWARAADTDRLADLVLSARDEVLALA